MALIYKQLFDVLQRHVALGGDRVQVAEAILGVADEDDQTEVVQQILERARERPVT